MKKPPPFGQRIVEKFNEGDLVEWGMSVDRKNGILIKKYVENYDEMRSYWMAEVRQDKTEKIFHLLLATLHLVQSSVE